MIHTIGYLAIISSMIILLLGRIVRIYIYLKMFHYINFKMFKSKPKCIKKPYTHLNNDQLGVPG